MLLRPALPHRDRRPAPPPDRDRQEPNAPGPGEAPRERRAHRRVRAPSAGAAATAHRYRGRQDLNLRPPGPQPEGSVLPQLRCPISAGFSAVDCCSVSLNLLAPNLFHGRWRERLVDHLDLVLGRGVVGVDLGRLGVGVAEELLDRAHRLPVGGQARAERVAQIVESDRGDSGSPTCRLEALGDLGAVERVAGLRVGEDEVLVGVVGRARDQRSSSRASRSAIGTERRVERSDLPSAECSPRTKALRTRMRCAVQSTSRQRRPSSSDCRKPVIAAVRIRTRSTGPSTSGGGGGAGPGRPRASAPVLGRRPHRGWRE